MKLSKTKVTCRFKFDSAKQNHPTRLHMPNQPPVHQSTYWGRLLDLASGYTFGSWMLNRKIDPIGSAPAHLKQSSSFRRKCRSSSFSLGLWLLSGPDLNPVDYIAKIWWLMQEHVYKTPIEDTSQLKQHLNWHVVNHTYHKASSKTLLISGEYDIEAKEHHFKHLLH